MNIFKVGLCSVILVSTGINAGEQKPLENGPPLENGKSLDDLNEISGVVIDRTMTRFGGEFYSVFSQLLNDKYEDLEENLTVKERATALSGSIITIFHRQTIIYRTALSPGIQQIESKANDAVKAVGSYMVKWRLERYLKDTFDVDYDEI
ncbi:MULTISPECIES: CsgE family curli-type amyloid fiber assembly protein [Photobacterium]|uniref:CsgE family curli-type amyloid fiber assembly protein n=1 Tax=Photobacterium TaxID=657 RepID=UPI00056A95E9|nr:MULTISPECIES: CsgE family curli-type amyloid fiber assembly protein [Photobacterium]